MPHRRVRTPVEQLQPFERGRIVDLRKAGWTYRRIAAYVVHTGSVVYRCFQQWCLVHSRTRRPGSGRLGITDACQNTRIMRAAVAARTASRGEILTHVAPAVSPRTIGDRLLGAGLRSRVPLAMATTYTTTPTSTATRS